MHHVRHTGHNLKVEMYHSKSMYTTYGSGKETSEATSFKAELFESSAVSFIVSELVTNAAFKNRKSVAFGSSFVDTSNIAPSTPSIALDSSLVSKVEEILLGAYGIMSLEYLAQPGRSVALTHIIQVQNDDANAWYKAFIHAHSGEIFSVTDFVSEATFTVVPITKDAVTEGEETLVDSEDLTSSASGWIASNQTAGNNVIAYKSSQSATTSQSSADTFDYPYDTTLGPTGGSNIDAARTNAFYIINKGGAEDDRVLMSVQDSGGTNNANFATPPDDQSGTCKMYIWTLTTPNRDGSLQNDIIVHEFTHGITNRLTGGGTGRCVQTTEAGGMGKGWSDAMAEWTEHKDSSIPDYALAT
ncbi:uncharacterized protein ARMOST_21660 [Armillaria ostoyae]|uniref:Extracellular metalloproteinase n=1 Tax=Armillaria ostoyae TaxID=47428 RepID=A0A284SAQ9_ARMOS|nr:uncharacterized protein ARMOST_21660 [Armillaria ostoyae]